MRPNFKKQQLYTLALFLSSFTVFAFGILLSGPGGKDFLVPSETLSSPTDTVIKGKPATPDSAFVNTMRRADILLRKNQFKECIAELEKAQKMHPTDKAVNAKLAQVKGMIAENDKKKVDYSVNLASGDAAFQKKDYLNAKAYYQLALNVFPTDSIAGARLRKTMELLRSQKAQNTLFDVAVASADRLFQAGEYERAKTEYENASRILPSDPYPKQKVNEIIQILVEQQLQAGKYAEAIKAADRFYAASNWQPALLEYQNASKLRPQEKYPKDRIAELTVLVEAQRKKDEAYIKLIASADAMFSVKAYGNARKDYESASKLKPEQVYPKNRIAEIDKLLAQGAKLQKDYDELITLADSFYIEKSFIRAMALYSQALEVKPSENYPKEMLEKVKPLAAAEELNEKSKESAQQLAARKAEQERLAAAQKAREKARQDSLLAVQKALELKVAAAQKAREKARQDSLLAVQKIRDKARQDSLLAVQKLRDKARQDSLLAAQKLNQARQKAQQDSLLAAQKLNQARQKAKQDSLLAAQKARQDSLALAQRAREKARRDSLLAVQKGRQDSINARTRENDSLYSAAMASAEKLFRSKSYSEARPEYQKALALKPAEKLPARRIISIDSAETVMRKLKSIDDQYAGLIQSADRLFESKTYDAAKAEYQKASAVKPTESYPKSRIQEIERQLALIKAENERLLAEEKARQKAKQDSIMAVQKARQDSLLAAQKARQDSILAAQKARQDSLLAAQKARQDSILAARKALEAEYSKVMASAEQSFKSRSFTQARADYQKALGMKPSELLPKRRINSIDSIERVRDNKYQAAITAGEKLFESKSYAPAKVQFETALALKPEETYPKEKIAAIDRLLEDIAKQKALNDEQYASLIKSADQFFASASFDLARLDYLKASELKPNEAYPRTRIQESEKQLAEIARIEKIEKSYQSAIKEGDSLFLTGNFLQCKTSYQRASSIKPSEAYPKDRIAQADKSLEEIAKQQALDKRYNEMISSADKLFDSKSFSGAKTAYAAALEMKPAESYPSSRINEIVKIEQEELRKKKALDDQYSALIISADKLFLARNYENARQEYLNASELKPSEAYPKTKIAEAEKAMTEIAARKAKDSAYSAVIASADKLLAAKSYEESKAEYQKALQIKPEQTYPAAKIAEVDKAVAEIARQKDLAENRYKSAVAKADQLLSSKSYDLAKAAYAAVLELKPGDQYPQDKIREIDVILAELKARDEAYRAEISKADQSLLEKKYEESRTAYENALSIKPGDQYASNKVEEINKKLVEIQGRKKTFDDLVVKGNSSYSQKDYGKAKEYFQQAVALFPDEKSIKDKLDRVGSVIDSLYRVNRGKYDKAVADGDRFFNGFEYDKAVDAYTEASVLLPMENYPKEMIARIHRTIAENAIADVLNSPVTITSNEEKQFRFTPLNIAARKNNFIYVKLRNLSGRPFNVLLRYGKDKTSSGGVVIRNLGVDGKVNERLISVREQDAWYRIDNDYISLYPQGGDIEVTFIQVSRSR